MNRGRGRLSCEAGHARKGRSGQDGALLVAKRLVDHGALYRHFRDGLDGPVKLERARPGS